MASSRRMLHILLALAFAGMLWAQDAGAQPPRPPENRDLLTDSPSVASFGARGDGRTDDTASIQRALNAACDDGPSRSRLRMPPGRYLISEGLVARCNMFISGAGPTATVIFDTVQANGRRSLSTDYSLELQDLAIDTTPLKMNRGMTAVARGFGPPSASSLGQTFTFIRFYSTGYNFSLNISGLSDTDTFASLTIRDCKLQVSTETNAVSAPINAANGDAMTVQRSTLLGDHRNDHAIYALGIRDVLIENNHMSAIGNSAIKLLTGVYGRGAACPAVTDDYKAWRILNNTIEDSVLAIAAYTYCDIKLPLLNIAGNEIRSMTDAYRGDYAAVFIQANCRSEMTQVSTERNSFKDLGLGGIVLLSSLQIPNDGCRDAEAMGTIRAFTSTSDSFANWSSNAAGVFPAINASGRNLLEASVSNMTADPQANASVALSGFAHLTVDAPTPLPPGR